ncbi:serine hydrolase [Roseomonas mucosa]|uniref:serine hydrolase n=1 Tax=Roseomonas mucosa TaxID=207340 RepID=UPI001DDFE5B7|nr:serine hydrolase [Roseomonas mucosa]MBS5905043.1 serine hydrolase [Acetobacteraceae bacterium]MCG7353307.1 class A beta-lactamase-related serine hydrolase [Roseomonas mucosa]
MRRRDLVAVGTAAIVTAADGAQAADAPAVVLERLFRQAPVNPGWFAPSFLAQVSSDQVKAIVDDLVRRHGPVQSVAGEQGWLVVRLARAEVPAQITLDAQGRITGLLFRPATPIVTDLDEPARAIAALPGRTAALVLTDGRTRLEHAADVPLAVGSAFKLAVLRAVAMACDDGRLGWDRVVRTGAADRSLPSGILQDWPAGTPITVAALANLMIALSDNTATDVLIRLVGHAAVSALSPRNTPFLTTRAAFVLKARANAALRRNWAAGTPSERLAILDAAAALPLPRPAELAPGVTSEVEWFFTARELAALLESIGWLPALGINKGPVDPVPWRSVAFKGGSEPGVLNLSALLATESGRRHCIVVTWNNTEETESERLIEPFRALVGKLSREE